MKVFKFGGGVLKDAEAVRQMTDIVRTEKDLICVVSAFSKMTNAFEKIVGKGYGAAESEIREVEVFHYAMAKELFEDTVPTWEQNILPIFKELKVKIEENHNLQYDQSYDQIVCYGEILSSAIISCYWSEIGLVHETWDASKVIITDSSYRSGRVNWELCEEKTQLKLSEGQSSGLGIVLTQGFIGGTIDGYTTTLGREGSDYTAAVLGNLYGAEEVVVWKDVPGIMTADPAEFENTSKMDEISYLEAVELSYFGAKVIHPNTIRPLQNKGIPLVVKSLYSPDDDGTQIISKAKSAPAHPIFIKKENQVLVSIQARDFSFIIEDALARIFNTLAKHGIRINLMQHGAVSISLVFDWDRDRLDGILGELLPEFKILYNQDLELWTIRQYTKAAIDSIVGNKRIYVQQKSRKTARFVLG